ncbi:hypothetical protein SYK_07050 [Pseudodesulfovibrio nedwellii]|uniref:DUF4398 domain-containing protein n=1 Tax=Pseudodesulfovibrio nedwellii TaxID=2973072 RepID=A0ABM8AY07_9BACT|nr:hypothetical protein [Pseudodesulfovibrio nedwellii]BDQ36345.1 hypothetical protein SYK_07050 [Pseudodesulfovibrio nedwellii]
MNGLPRTSYKAKSEKLEIALNHARRRADWAERDAKVAKYDLAEAKKKIASLEQQLRQQQDQFSFDGVA